MSTNWEYFNTAQSADLADEPDLFRVQALADPDFEGSPAHWDEFILESMIWLPRAML
ncbi:MAG: hypothetical protein IPG64_21325 [Haliea sp.]|nr:hypothetical protein [Haliea sp.]